MAEESGPRSPPPAAPAAVPLSPSKKENARPIDNKMAELNQSQAELATRLQVLKQELQSWRSKLTTQVKTYKDGKRRTCTSWLQVRAVYLALPDFQRERLAAMGFAPFLSIEVCRFDTALLYALHDRWDPVSRAFLFPWGHMVPTLEDVARLTGLRVHGLPVSGTTFPDYRALARELLGLELRRPERQSTLLPRADLQDSLGLRRAGVAVGEQSEQHLEWLIGLVRPRVAAGPGAEADRVLRRFLMLLFGWLLFSTRADVMSCCFLPFFQELEHVGDYAWGAAVLAFLFDTLSSIARRTMLGGFSPLLQVWAYVRLRGLNRGEETRPGLLPIARRWTAPRETAALRRQIRELQDDLDALPFASVRWTPYSEEGQEDQPWVAEALAFSGRDVWLHYMNVVEPLHFRLVLRTIGVHQPAVEFPTAEGLRERVTRTTRGLGAAFDWSARNADQVADWTARGREVTARADSDSAYYAAYARHYRDQVFRGAHRPIDPEGRLAELQGLLHSPIRERDEARQALDLLRAEGAQRAGPDAPSSSTTQTPTDRAERDVDFSRMVARARAAEVTLTERTSELTLARAELEQSRAAAREEASALREETARLREELARDRPSGSVELALLRAEVERLRASATEAERYRTEAEQAQRRVSRLEGQVDILREMSQRSRSGAPSRTHGSFRTYLTGSSGHRRNEEEESRRRRRDEATSAMGPPSKRLEGGGDSDPQGGEGAA